MNFADHLRGNYEVWYNVECGTTSDRRFCWQININAAWSTFAFTRLEKWMQISSLGCLDIITKKWWNHSERENFTYFFIEIEMFITIWSSCKDTTITAKLRSSARMIQTAIHFFGLPALKQLKKLRLQFFDSISEKKTRPLELNAKIDSSRHAKIVDI